MHVFFYGLFMDPDVLRAKGLDPGPPRAAAVSGLALQLGERAILVRRDGLVAYDIVMALTEPQLAVLYSEACVSAYRPEPVVASATTAPSFR